MLRSLSKLGLLIPETLYDGEITAKHQREILKKGIIKGSSTQNNAQYAGIVMAIVESYAGFTPAEIAALLVPMVVFGIAQHQLKKMNLMVDALDGKIEKDGDDAVGMSKEEFDKLLGDHCIITPSMEEKVINAATSLRACFTWPRGQGAPEVVNSNQRTTELSNLLN